MEYDFQAFKERLAQEVPRLAQISSLSAAPLRITMNEDNHEVDLFPVYFPFQVKETLSKGKSITLQAFTFQLPSVQEVWTGQSEVQTNHLASSQPKHLTMLLEEIATDKRQFES